MSNCKMKDTKSYIFLQMLSDICNQTEESGLLDKRQRNKPTENFLWSEKVTPTKARWRCK